MAKKKVRQAQTCFGVPIPLTIKGVREKGRSIIRWRHICCKCGLKHDVDMEHDGATPEIKATFKQLE